MACTPVTKFDGFTQMLASGVTRRDAMKWVGASALGAMLATVGVKQAEAANKCAGTESCVGSQCKDCPSGLGCYCFQKVNKPKAKCLQNQYCAQIPTCSTNKDCPSGQKCICSANGCSVSVCLPKCTSCPTSGSGGGGKTAA
jgi:hypothetical protein